MAKYSVSQIQSYLQCPLQYRYHYIDKIPTLEFEETVDTLLWSLVHKSLENLYDSVNVFKIPTKEDVIKWYYDLWEQKEKEIAENWWEIKNNHSDLSIDDFKRRWEVYLSRYYDKHSPFEDIKVISTEKQLWFKLDENINFYWIIDRLDKIWDNFIISDYKTNKNLPEKDKNQYIEQLTLYWLGVLEHYWKYLKDDENLKARLYFLHFDIEEERELTKDKLTEKVSTLTAIAKIGIGIVGILLFLEDNMSCSPRKNNNIAEMIFAQSKIMDLSHSPAWKPKIGKITCKQPVHNARNSL